jgi:hypothetical protein
MRLHAPLLIFALLAAAPGCAMLQPAADVPSVPARTASAAERAHAAALLREGLRAQNPPRGTRPDPDRAAALIEEAATLGDPDAQLLVAAGHLARPDGSRDTRAAFPWLVRAAEGGQPEAQLRLARMIEAGDGTTREPAWAAVWFGRAAERGVAEAQFALGMMQIAGTGVARDEAEALARLRIAEAAGITPARRYREALEPRVSQTEAAAALTRVRGETARGPVATPDRPLVRFAQSALAALGALPATEVDGRDGPTTRAALSAFARREGIAAPPYAPATIDRLRDRMPAG